MRKISIASLKAGDKFSKPVYVDGANLLVPENISIKGKDIERLKKWGISEVFTDGELVGDEIKTAPVLKNLPIGSSTQHNSKIYKTYIKVIGDINSIFEKIRTNKEVKLSEIDSITNEILELIKDNKDEVINTILMHERTDLYMAENAINTAILSAIIANTIKIPNYKIIHLCIAALLHDLGMMTIPDKILNKKEELTPEEFKLMETHPLNTYKIISKVLKYPEEIAVIALQHHERWDGNGYPKKIKGENILVTARILSIADAFSAMGSSRPYRESMIGYNAVRNILNDNSRRFDSNILKIFINKVGIYPVGSFVLLSNSSIGRVVSINGEAPLRPRLEIIIEKNEKVLEGKTILIDLLQEKNIFIVKALDPQELAKKL